MREALAFTLDRWKQACDLDPEMADRVSGRLAELGRTNYAAYLRTDYWAAIREAVVERDHRSCWDCNERTEQLHVHHTTYEILGYEWRDLSPLLTLCTDCHADRHGITEGRLSSLRVDLLKFLKNDIPLLPERASE